MHKQTGLQCLLSYLGRCKSLQQRIFFGEQVWGERVSLKGYAMMYIAECACKNSISIDRQGL